jgi:hypothetical protein
MMSIRLWPYSCHQNTEAMVLMIRFGLHTESGAKKGSAMLRSEAE